MLREADTARGEEEGAGDADEDGAGGEDGEGDDREGTTEEAEANHEAVLGMDVERGLDEG